MRKKRKIVVSTFRLKSAEKARREMEIMLYGKLIHRLLIFVDKTVFQQENKHKKINRLMRKISSFFMNFLKNVILLTNS